MKIITLIPLLLVLISACSTNATRPIQVTQQEVDTGALLLKNGSYVFVSDDGTMRMTDHNGKQIKMNDGIEMELQNGDLIMMKNNRVWRSQKPTKRHDHKKMK